MMGNARGLSPLVIPGRAKREPGIHASDRGYGFSPAGSPGMTSVVVTATD